MKGSYELHQYIISKFKVDVMDHIPGIRVFDRHVGLFYRRNGTPIKINHKGMADCYALLPTQYGLLHIELEFKTGGARTTKEQRIWKEFIESNNGIYMVIREDYHNSITELKNRVESLINVTTR